MSKKYKYKKLAAIVAENYLNPFLFIAHQALRLFFMNEFDFLTVQWKF